MKENKDNDNITEETSSATPATEVAVSNESSSTPDAEFDTEPSTPADGDAEPSKGDSAAATPPPTENKKSRPWLAIIALLLAVITLAGGVYLYLQLHKMQAENETVAQTATSASESVDSVRSAHNSLDKSVNSSISQLSTDMRRQRGNLEEMQQRLTQTVKQISQLGSNSRKDWLLAEAQYLLRLANQRILLENSPAGALALMKSTDEILRETDDVSLYNVRKALAMDIAALEAVPKLDVDGVFLKLVALNQQVDKLSLLPVSESPELPDMLKEVDEEVITETWQQGLKEGWSNAMDKLGSLIIIQHRDEAIEPLLTHEQGYYIQQNLHLMIEQAQLALLQGHQQSYDASLNKATDWVNRYFRQDDSTTQALVAGLNQLKPVQVAPKLPDISGSLRALKQYFADIQSRQQ